ncbi:MAG: PAS domain S-box protein [Candidatus Heimdallarchaeota archaeon]|nr:PAS domain S-box protein [Candidatus Heimdallarchaeota archaeon]MDH5645330.1 PAS domain S-box protein [Candidatus Heimdallarchaeota archaeon]
MLKNSNEKDNFISSRSERLFSMIHDSILIVSDKKISFVNPQFTEEYGYTIDDLGNIDVVNLFSGSELDYFFNRPIPTFYNLQLKIKTKSGSFRHCRITGSVKTEQNEIVDLDMIIRDNSDKLLQETLASQKLIELQASHDVYKALVDNLPVGIILNEIEGPFNLTNNTLEKMLGYTKEELLKLSTSDISFEEDMNVQIPMLHEMIQGKRDRFVHRKRYKTKSGEVIWVDISYQIIKDPKTKKKYYFSMANDITQKLLDEEIKHRLLEQNHNLQKMDTVAKLTGGLAHDLGNLFAVINANIEYLAEIIEDNEDIQSSIESIKNFSSRGSSLISEIMNISKSAKIEKTEIDIHDLLETIISVSQTSMKNVNFEKKFSARKSRINLSLDKFQNVFLNLIVNAKDAMPDGGRITINTKNVSIFDLDKYEVPIGRELPDNFIEISLKDTGIGISKGDISKIFDPFFTTKTTGTGLGLSNVYNTVLQHHGFINVNSEINEGTEFDIYLPL